MEFDGSEQDDPYRGEELEKVCGIFKNYVRGFHRQWVVTNTEGQLALWQQGDCVQKLGHLRLATATTLRDLLHGPIKLETKQSEPWVLFSPIRYYYTTTADGFLAVGRTTSCSLGMGTTCLTRHILSWLPTLRALRPRSQGTGQSLSTQSRGPGPRRLVSRDLR